MSSRRALKVAEAIREVVSMAILTELQDPRIREVTVTHVEISADLRHAKVHVSVRGDDTMQNLSLRGLQNSAGFLQSKLAKELDLRYTPKLLFLLDQGVKKSLEIAQILKEVLPPAEESQEENSYEDDSQGEYSQEDATEEDDSQEEENSLRNPDSEDDSLASDFDRHSAKGIGTATNDSAETPSDSSSPSDSQEGKPPS